MPHPDNDERRKPGNWWAFGPIDECFDRATWKGLYRAIPANENFPAADFARGRAAVRDDWE